MLKKLLHRIRDAHRRTFGSYILAAAVTASPFISSSPANAYDVDAGHEPLMTLSLDLYARCFPQETLFRSRDARARLIQGDRAMDTGRREMLHKLHLSEAERSSLRGDYVFWQFRRLWNWHFYNPDRAAYSRVGLIEQSYQRLWADLKEGLSKNQGSNKLIFIGGLMHLVEDVTVPAHSIPVYHGPATGLKLLGPIRFRPLIVYMEEAGRVGGKGIMDPIDWIRPDAKRLTDALQPTKSFCLAIGPGRETPEAIRDDLVRKIQTVLQTEIPGCAGVAWRDFWVYPAGDQYFGRYNIGQGRPMFGEQGVVASRNGKSCPMQKNDPRYSDLVFLLHQEAVKADLKMLKWAATQLR